MNNEERLNRIQEYLKTGKGKEDLDLAAIEQIALRFSIFWKRAEPGAVKELAYVGALFSGIMNALLKNETNSLIYVIDLREHSDDYKDSHTPCVVEIIRIAHDLHRAVPVYAERPYIDSIEPFPSVIRREYCDRLMKLDVNCDMVLSRFQRLCKVSSRSNWT